MLTQKELQSYSLSHALRCLSSRESSLEGEISKEAAERSGTSLNDRQLMIPWQALQKHARRDMTAAGVSGSQYLVATESQAPELVLATASAAIRAGARVLPNLKSDIVVPVSSGETCYWLSDEATEATEAQPTLREASLSPKHVVALVQTTHRFETQARAAGVDVDQFLAADLTRSLGRALDTAILQGSGTSGQPLGLAGRSGVQAVDSGTALSWGDIGGLLADVADENAESVSWIGAPDTRKILSNRARLSGGSIPIWNDAEIAGCRAFATTAAPAGSLFVGDWTQAVIGVWREGVVITINPHSDFARGYSMHRGWLMADVGFMRPECFGVVSSIT